MSRRLLSALEEQTGSKPVDVAYDSNGIKQVRFAPETSYETVANAAAALNADTEDGLVIWGCGHSKDGQPTVAIQLFDSFLENAERKLNIESTISREYGGEYRANARARREVITSYPDSPDDTLLTE